MQLIGAIWPVLSSFSQLAPIIHVIPQQEPDLFRSDLPCHSAATGAAFAF